MRRQLVLLCVAAQFLTRLPVPSLSGFEPRWLAQSTRYFPLIGLVVGALDALIWAGLIRVLPAAVAVGLMLAASALITGAFHEDGFADACDGLGGGRERAQVLAIMKDSRIGTYGTLGLILGVGLKWTVLTALPASAFAIVLIAAHTVSRWAAIGLIVRLPYARTDGEATARPFAGRLSAAEWALSGVIGLAALTVAIAACVALGGVLELKALLFGSLAAVLSSLIAGTYFRQRIGGYTGDCLGAAQQLAELAFLLFGLAVIAPPHG